MGLMTTFLNITPIFYIEHLFAYPFIGDFSASEEKNARKTPFFGAIFPIFQKATRTSVRFYVFFLFLETAVSRGKTGAKVVGKHKKSESVVTGGQRESIFSVFNAKG